MARSYDEPFARLTDALDEIASINPAFRTTGEKQEVMAGLAGFIARAQAQQLRVLAVSHDVAEETGARSAAAWLADETRDAPGRLRADAKLAAALDERWTRLAAAFGEGEINLAQVRAISDALGSMPRDLGDDLLSKAEAFLVAKAAELGPRELANLGRGVLQHLAPDIADEVEYQALLAAEDRASAATRLTLRRRGDGSTDGTFRIPDALAGRLRAYVHAYTSPRGDISTLPSDPSRRPRPTSSRSCRSPAGRALRSQRSSNTFPRTPCPNTVAPPPPSSSPSTMTACWPRSTKPGSSRPRPGT